MANPINNYYISNSINKLKEFSTLATGSSLINNKNKMKQFLIESNYNNSHWINHSYSNIIRIDNCDRIKIIQRIIIYQ